MKYFCGRPIRIGCTLNWRSPADEREFAVKYRGYARPAWSLITLDGVLVSVPDSNLSLPKKEQ